MSAGAAPARSAPDLGAVRRRLQQLGARWRLSERPARPIGRRVAALASSAALVLAVSVVVTGLAVVRLDNSVHAQVDRTEPAGVAAARLDGAVVSQQTGVRGYVLSGSGAVLQEYERGLSAERAAVADLRRYLSGEPRLSRAVSLAEKRAEAWREGYAVRTIREVAAGSRWPRSPAATERGSLLFGRFRSAMGRVESALGSMRRSADRNVTGADHELVALLGLCLLALLSVLEVTWLLIRRWLTSPIEGLAADVRMISGGSYDHRIAPGGSLELKSLASDVDAMRNRIISDLGEVEEARRDLARKTVALEQSNSALARSNSALEQFAYLSSHDLQEPLRKIASFSELVVRRYGDRLDEQGREYLGFVASGARRMQTLVSDVLDLSRVGRSGRPLEPVDLNEAFVAARSNLQGAIERAGAVVEAGELPVVWGDRLLLVTLFENLIGNSVKFRSAELPTVLVSAGESAEGWEIAVEDNGAGIAPEHAERVFTIFQRLHGRSEHPGTGVGLTLCRRIAEYHGGGIRVDDSWHRGTRMVVTLPEAERRQGSVAR